MIRSDLCDFTDGYVVVIEKITIYKTENENRNIDTHNRKLNLKNCAPCASYILEINNAFRDDAADFYIDLCHCII